MNTQLIIFLSNRHELHITRFFCAEKPGAPDAPTVSNITSTSCTVNWQPPLQNGGSPILGYHLERHVMSSTRWVKQNKDMLSDTVYQCNGEYMSLILDHVVETPFHDRSSRGIHRK